MKQNDFRAWRRRLASVGVLLVAGCATIPELQPTVDRVPVREKIHARAALVIPESTRNFDKPNPLPIGSCITMGMEFRNNYGEAFEASMKATLAQAFDDVTVMRTPPQPGSNYGAVLEATLTRIDWKLACLTDPTGYVEPHGTLRALDVKGKEIWKASIETTRSPANATMSMQEFSQYFARGLSALAAAWVNELQGAPAVMMASRVDAEGLYQDSRQAESRGDYFAALKAMRTLMAADPNEASTYARVGEFLLRLCDVEGARRAAEQGAARFPGDAQIAALQASVGAPKGGSGYAAACKAQALNREGVQLARQQKTAEALGLFAAAIKTAPGVVPKAYYNAGLLLEGAGKAQDALKQYSAAYSSFVFEQDELDVLRKMVDLAQRAGLSAPDSADQKYRLGIVRTQQKRYQEAVKNFEAALEEAPWIVDAYYNLGLVYDATAAYANALRVLRIYAGLAPRSSNIGAVKTKIVELEDRLGLIEAKKQ